MTLYSQISVMLAKLSLFLKTTVKKNDFYWFNIHPEQIDTTGPFNNFVVLNSYAHFLHLLWKISHFNFCSTWSFTSSIKVALFMCLG